MSKKKKKRKVGISSGCSVRAFPTPSDTSRSLCMSFVVTSFDPSLVRVYITMTPPTTAPTTSTPTTPNRPPTSTPLADPESFSAELVFSALTAVVLAPRPMVPEPGEGSWPSTEAKVCVNTTGTHVIELAERVVSRHMVVTTGA